MPEESKTQQIEKRLDLQVSGGIALSGNSAGTLTIAPQNMAEMFEFAKMMAISGPCVRPAFRGNPGACLAIALQAFRTGADPFAVSNKAYITRSRDGDEQIAYEAQYIHSVINTSGKLAKRLRPIYSGAGQSRKCKIVGHVKGEDDDEPLEYESPSIAEIAVKNSPLWKGDPDQQLFYYSVRAWGRRHLPEVLLGMYTPDEIRGEIIDMTPVETAEAPPRPQRADFVDAPAEGGLPHPGITDAEADPEDEPASPGSSPPPAEAQERAGTTDGSPPPPAPGASGGGGPNSGFAELLPDGSIRRIEPAAASPQAAAEVGTSAPAVASPAAPYAADPMSPRGQWAGVYRRR